MPPNRCVPTWDQKAAHGWLLARPKGQLAKLAQFFRARADCVLGRRAHSAWLAILRQHRQPRLRLRRRMLQTRPQVTDAADGSDGVMESALLYGRYPDRPRSQPPLAAEDNLNPEGAKEGLCPAQPTSECARALWPARPVGADLQKVRCASRPLRSVEHDLAHMGRHRVGVDDALDRIAPVVGISVFEGARGSKGALTGRGPEREVSHARQPLEAHPRQHV